MVWKKFFIELRVPATSSLQIKFNIYNKKQIKLDFRALTTKGFLLLILILADACDFICLLHALFILVTQIKNIQIYKCKEYDLV